MVRGASLYRRCWLRGGSGNPTWKWDVKRAHRSVCKNTWGEKDSLRVFWRKFLLLPVPLSSAQLCMGNESNGKRQLPTARIDGKNHVSPSFQHQTTVVPPHCCQGFFPFLFRKLPTLRHHYCTERQTHFFCSLFRLVIMKNWLWQRPIVQWSITCPEVLTAPLQEVDTCRLEEPMETVQKRAALCCLGNKKGHLLDLQSHVLCSTSNDYRAVSPRLGLQGRRFISKLQPYSFCSLEDVLCT